MIIFLNAFEISIVLFLVLFFSFSCDKDSKNPTTPTNQEEPKETEVLTGHFFGISPTYNHYVPEQEYSDYKSMGIRSVRVHYQDNISDTYFDQVVLQYTADSIEVMMLVSYESYPSEAVDDVPPWGGLRLKYTNPMALVDKLADIVPRLSLRGVRAWEIWNEENGSWYIPPEEYGALISTVYEKFKYTDKWDPNAKIIFGGLDASAGPWDASGSNGAAKEYLQKVYASKAVKAFRQQYGHSPFDAMAIHPYNVETKQKFNTNLSDVCYSNMTSYGDDTMPIWITELGDASTDDTQQAERLETYVKAALAHPLVERLHWFKYTYPSGDAHQYYSIVMQNGRHREAFTRYKNLIQQANNGELLYYFPN
jgi:hypothetical protein